MCKYEICANENFWKFVPPQVCLPALPVGDRASGAGRGDGKVKQRDLLSFFLFEKNKQKNGQEGRWTGEKKLWSQ